MIVVHVWGGLGNQLFQYSFYEFLKQNNEDVYLDLSSYKIQKYHYGLELDKLFALEYREYPGKQFAHCNRNSFFYRAFRKFLGITLAKKADFYEKDQVAMIRAERFEEDIYFDGFWQGAPYVQNTPGLQEKFVFRELKLNERNQELADFIDSHIAVSVHIRRGDYMHHPEFQGCCGEDYYNRAIAYFQEHIQPNAFVFFSDDIDWCKEKFGHLPNSRFVDWNTGENSYMDLYLMSRCGHNIIANSTFSWWGAYLNANENKVVVLPRKWKNTVSSEHYACDGWLRM